MNPPTLETGDVPKPEIQLRSHSTVVSTQRLQKFHRTKIYPSLSLKEQQRVNEDGIKLESTKIFNFDELTAFVRLLAKVAYCTSIAKLGVEKVSKNYLTPIILGKDNLYNRYVGTVPFEKPIKELNPLIWQPERSDHPDKKEIHRITFIPEDSYWVAYIQLYKYMYVVNKNPIHKVIIGLFS